MKNNSQTRIKYTHTMWCTLYHIVQEQKRSTMESSNVLSYFQVISTDLLNWSDFLFSMTLFTSMKIVKSVMMNAMRICYFTFYWGYCLSTCYMSVQGKSDSDSGRSKLDNCLAKQYYSHTVWVHEFPIMCFFCSLSLSRSFVPFFG